MGQVVKFGILGCANIARSLVRAMSFLPEIKIQAIASRSLAKAHSFAAANNVPKETTLYGSYEELLEDEEVDAVYIPLPTGLHVEWVLKAAEKKKHVLLEKPPAHTVEELDIMLDALRGNGLQYMDGTMWVHHPRVAAMQKFLHDTEIVGKVCEVHSVFNYDAHLAYKAAGGLDSDIRGQLHLDGLGALGDIGWYCARGILWANGYELPETVTAHPGALYNKQGVITSCGATFVWADGRTAIFSTSFNTSHIMKLLVVGTNGSLEVDDFVIPYVADKATFKIVSKTSWQDLITGWHVTHDVHEVVIDLPQESLMVREFARLVSGVQNGTSHVDETWPDNSRKTQVLLNAVKQSIENGISISIKGK